MIMTNQKKEQTWNAKILTTNMDRIYHKNVLTAEIKILKLYQCLQPCLL